jgi:tRNA-2-methylthio-N6-dimethylallyladenosine synthase
MNKHDSERIAGLLVEEGYEPTENVESADVIVFNTCSVREHAAQRVYGRVGVLKALKDKKPDLVIAIGGCLAQQEGKKIQSRFPHVGVVFGTHNLSNLPKLIKQAQENSKKTICELLAESDESLASLPSLRQEQWRAWVPITTGCNNFCSYCIVPYVRGREHSRKIEDILVEAEKLSQEGVIEITLLGQNVNSYGHDLYGKSNFALLLREIDKIDGLNRVRFMTSHPRDLGEDVIEAVAASSNICEHFHLPVQAGSDRILKLMNRGYTQEQYLNLVGSIRKAIPFASITTDIIVGFPGETEEDFEETLRVVEKAKFDQAFTFLYSPREGTPAATMDEQVQPAVKNKRFKRLLESLSRIYLEQNRFYCGKTIEVLVEDSSKKSPAFLTGRTRTNKVVNFAGSTDLVQQLVEVEIDEAHVWYLKGRCVEQKSEVRINKSP